MKTAHRETAFIDSVAGGMAKLYDINKTAKQLRIKRNDSAINEYALKFGKIILLSSQTGVDRLGLLEDYFRRDGVEKFFDTMKNEADKCGLGNSIPVNFDDLNQCIRMLKATICNNSFTKDHK